MRVVNANWTAGDNGQDGAFAFSVVTEDDERHVIEPSAQAAAVLVGLTQASSVLLWDPAGRTLIAANLVGEWLPNDWSVTSKL
ncbi:MAG: hypothetical protein WBG76_14710 [Ornithinimicrobium sp.]